VTISVLYLAPPGKFPLCAVCLKAPATMSLAWMGSQVAVCGACFELRTNPATATSPRSREMIAERKARIRANHDRIVRDRDK
jgi:ribosome-binding protein aMBF1 (putative translation factor)